jgi:hypothetical protein
MDSRLPDRTGNYQMEREERTTHKAGPKMSQACLALAARLLETMTDVAKDMRDEGTTAIQYTNLPLVGESFFIDFLNFFLTWQRGGTPVRLTARTSLKSTPAITQARVHSPATPHSRHRVPSSSLPGYPICVLP